MMMSLNQTTVLPMLIGVLCVPLCPPQSVTAKTAPQSWTHPAWTQMHTGGLLPGERSPILLAQRSNFTSFFEEGRSLSENQLRRQPPDPTIPVAQTAQAWQPVFFRSGGFSFWMPPGSLNEANIVLQTPVGGVSFRTLSANSETARYVVGYADQLTPAQTRNPQALLAAMSRNVITAQNFRLVRNQPITQGGVQGRELLYQSDTEVIAFRAFLRQNTAYLIGSRAPKSEGIPSRQTTIFLSSFEFLN